MTLLSIVITTFAMSVVACAAIAYALARSLINFVPRDLDDSADDTCSGVSFSPAVEMTPEARVALGMTGPGTRYCGGEWAAATDAVSVGSYPMAPAPMTLEGSASFTETSSDASNPSGSEHYHWSFGIGDAPTTGRAAERRNG